jgi:hypothetical protein
MDQCGSTGFVLAWDEQGEGIIVTVFLLVNIKSACYALIDVFCTMVCLRRKEGHMH